MGAASSNNDLPDWRAADQAGLTGTHVYMMLQLEEAADAVGVDIIGDGRSAEGDRLAEHRLQRRVQALQLDFAQAPRHAPGTDPGAEEAFVGVDIAYSMKQFLVEERGFNGETASVEELHKVRQ